MSQPKLHLYGADWCTKSALIRNYMQSMWIEFDDFNVEVDAEAEKRIRALFNGQLKFPIVMLGDLYLKNPDMKTLNTFLTEHKLLD